MDRVIAVDTETHGGTPFSIQVSLTANTGLMVLISNVEAVRALATEVNRLVALGFKIVLHNAVADLWIEQFGINCSSIRDTLQESFHLGNLPQGLKPLTYRLFGITMTSWEDVVRPASIRALENWMVEALTVAEADLHYAEHKHLKTKTKTIVKAGELEKLLKRMISHTDTSSDYDPWQRLDDFWAVEENQWQIHYVEARVGSYPILGIGNCRLEDAVRYGCSDAHFAGRVAVELERRRKDDYWTIAEGDEDQ